MGKKEQDTRSKNSWEAAHYPNRESF